MTITTKVLVDARARYAANPDHTPLGQSSDSCVVVAIDRALLHHGTWDKEAQVALARAAGIEGWTDLRIALIKWNAVASTEEVLAAFDRAIAEQKAMA